jgi:tellurite resistance protein
LSVVSPARVALGRYAIALGLAGLGGAWTEAGLTLGASTIVESLLVVAALVIWAWLTLRYFVYGVRTRGTFVADLDDETTGPFAAYIPVVAILIAAHFHQELGSFAPWINGLFVAGLAIVCAQLLTRWVSGSFDRDSLHPGYFLPVVAGPFIASLGFSTVAEHGAAVAAFGVGVFFWAITGSLVFNRLMIGSPLASASRPSLGILLAPPATGGVAWFVADGGHVDAVTEVLGGVLVLMLLLQLLLIPRYRRVAFSLDFWAFSFPLAASANYAVRWTDASKFPGWQIVSWIVLSVATAGIGALCVGSIALVLVRARHQPAEASPSGRRS